MAEPVITVDPRIYGGDAPNHDPVPEFDPNGLSANQFPRTPPTDTPQSEVGAGTQSEQIGKAAVAYNNRTPATMKQSVMAALEGWSPVRVFDWATMPNFEPDQDFDVKPYVNSVPFTMSEDEHKFLAQSQSEAEFQFRMHNTQKQRDLYQQMGDHPWLSTLTAMADPTYLAIDMASMGVATPLTAALGAGRVAERAFVGGVSAAGTYGLGRAGQQVAPISDKEVILGALMNGAASAMMVKGAKALKVDPEFPSEELTRAVNGLAGKAEGVESRVVSETADVAGTKPVTPVARAAEPVVAQEAKAAEAAPGKLFPEAKQAEAVVAREEPAAARAAETTDARPEFGQRDTEASIAYRTERGVKPGDPEFDAHTYLAKFENDKEFGGMVRALRKTYPELLQDLKVVESDMGTKGRPWYDLNNHTVYLNPKSADVGSGKGAAFTALHETVHGLTSQKIAYGLANPGSAHGKIVGQLERLRAETKDFLRAHPTNDARDAYLDRYYTGNPHEFTAGLFSGKDGRFAKLLSTIPAKAGGNVLGAVVNSVRKLLGIPPTEASALTKAIGLTEDLIKQPLDLKVQNLAGDTATHLLAPVEPKGTVGQKMKTLIAKEDKAAALGDKISISLHKTLTNLSSAGRKVADLLVDDPVNMRPDSVVSQRTAIRSDLSAGQFKYEDLLKASMAENGAGFWTRIMNPRKASAIQSGIEDRVYEELLRRQNAARTGGAVKGVDVDPKISAMADAHDLVTARALREMKAAGVLGADAIDELSGYTPRKWNVTKLEAFEQARMDAGMSEREAKLASRDLVADAMMQANPDWERGVAEDVASAILARTRAKGYFEDTAFRGHVGNAGAEQIRSILSTTGISPERIQRAIDVVTGVTDEAGKSANLKHRVDMDALKQFVTKDGEQARVMDLLDTNVTRNLDGYLDRAAGDSALARKGLKSGTDIAALRKEYLAGVEHESDRAKAADYFDNTIAAIQGNPVGEKIADGMRKLQAITQMVGLAMSGLWQLTEYANPMAKYGLFKTTTEVFRNMPVFRTLMSEVSADRKVATSLNNVLSHNSSQDMRLRPYVQKMEDNFAMDMGDHVMLSLSQAKQAVPYLNAMKFIHHHQANTVANLITDVFHSAVNGDTKAIKTLEQYGLEGHTLDSIRSDVTAGGMDTAKWSDATWAQVRGPLAKMMDESVLKNRTGEIPAFAQFSSVGKFIFTFRSFVLGAHNKVLAGTLGREGFGGLGLLMMYQFPLTVAAAAANSVMKGKPEGDIKTLASQAVGQMGAMGILGELWGIASGDKQQFGASGLMFIDRLYKTGSAVANGQWGTAGAGLAASVPLLGILPGMKAFETELKSLNPKREPKHKD